MGENDERPKDALDARLQVFDKTHSGRITIFDTLFGKMKR
jgi:Ca2+-binding EF-hand superfamily protein